MIGMPCDRRTPPPETPRAAAARKAPEKLGAVCWLPAGAAEADRQPFPSVRALGGGRETGSGRELGGGREAAPKHTATRPEPPPARAGGAPHRIGPVALRFRVRKPGTWPANAVSLPF